MLDRSDVSLTEHRNGFWKDVSKPLKKSHMHNSAGVVGPAIGEVAM